MKNVIKIAIICLIIVSLYGYRDNKAVLSDINITKSNKNNSTLNPKYVYKFDNIGIYQENGKIIIDLNKTQEFLKEIAIKLKEEGVKVKEKTKDLNISSLGIKINKEKIKIDLNKTKTFLEKFSNIMEQITKDFNNSN